MAAGEGTLELVFRYVMLHYNSADGLRVLLPSDNHRAVLRDVSSGVTVPLSEAWIYLTSAGTALPAAPTTVVPDEHLLVYEKALKVADPQAPEAEFLETSPVSGALNALIHLAGGRLRAFTPEAYPERDDVVELEFGPSNVIATRITDTTVFDLPLQAGTRYELVVRSPRTTLRFDISGGARFEIRNEDDRRGALPDRVSYHSEELRSLLQLFGTSSLVQCDQYACMLMVCGDANLIRS